MGPIEDPDVALLGKSLADPPQETMALLFRRRRLEGADEHRLRVHVPDDVGDRSVLAAGVHGLEHDQQSTLALRIEPLLEFEKTVAVSRKIGLRPVLALQAGRRVRVDLDEPEAAVAGLRHQELADLLRRHARSLGELGGYYLERDHAVAADDKQRELRADAALDHQTLKITRFRYCCPIDLDDDVANSQVGRSSRTAGDNLLHLHACLASDALRERWSEGASAACDAQVCAPH